MKNILLYCILIIIILLPSCSDILEEKPQSLAVNTFYNTAGEVESAIGAIYTPLRSNFNSTYPSLLECSSDMFFTGRGSWVNPAEFQGFDSKNQTREQGMWGNFYSSIRNANLIIQNVPNSDVLSEEEKNMYIGEAQFLRALCYFHLIRNWGAVPLRTEENFDEFNVARTSVEDVYKFIISDLQSAETKLPDEPFAEGHPSKWVAKTVLSDVYFYTGDYDLATAKAGEVIDSNKYSLVEVQTSEDFGKIFGATVTNTTEEIFYLEYCVESSWGYLHYLLGTDQTYAGFSGYYVCFSNSDYIVYKNWDNDDLRKVYNWYEFSGGDPGTLCNKKFTDPGSFYPSNDYPFYRYTDLLLIYAEASCRNAGSPTTEGMEALNMVHRRAYGYPATQISPVDFKISEYSKESFIELCIKERGYETVAEAKRWFDLRRLGKEKAAEIIKATRGVDIADKAYLWPIPIMETEYNEAITDNNPGY